ncbi:hypothetical protein OAQ85_02665 [Schleiferiaceae bacterium]|nr:hypothetical protein [Schleiferiaceae bacterium]
MQKFFLLIGASLILFSSCKKDRVQVNTTANANPVIAVPIGEANLTLEHIIDPNDPNDTLISQNNGLYQVVLAQDNVVDQALTDLISLPAQNLVNQSVKMGSVPVDSFGVSESVSLNDLLDDLGSSAQSGLNVSLDDINATQAISLQGVIDTAGGSLQSSLSVGDINTSQSLSLDDLMANGGGLASSLSISDFSTNQSVSLDDLMSDGNNSLSSSLTISDFSNNQSVTLDDLASIGGGAIASSLTISDFSNNQSVSLDDLASSAGGALSSSLTINDFSNSQSVTLDNLASTGGGALASSLNINDFSSNQDITLESISTSIGGSFASALSVSDVSESQDITLGQVATDAGLTAINNANGANSPFPPMNESNVGPYSGGSLGNFTDVTLSAGDLTLTVTNNWPVPMNMDIDLINTADNSVIFSYTFLNIPANGGTDSETKSLIGETLPSTMGFLMTNISSPGSGSSFVVIDTSDAITMDIATAGMVASSYNAPFPSVNQSNVGTYGSGGSLGTFDNATFSAGDLTLSFTNNWPVAMSMDVDVVDTLTNATILSYSFNNIAGNGGSSSQSKSLVGITLPSTMGLRISSVNSAGSGASSVPIDLQDNITLGISGTNLEASSLNAPFPSVNQTNLGTFSGGNLGNFTDVTLSDGALALSITNDWPVSMSMGIDIVDTITNTTILTYNFNGISANGGTASQSQSLVGITLPSSMGFAITSVNSPGSGSNSVAIDVQDQITFDISGTNLEASSLNAPFPSVNQTNVGTFGAGNLGSFTDVTLSDGNLALSLTNDWPVSLSMDIEIVDTLNPGVPILTYTFNNVGANGGTANQNRSLVGVTLPSSLGLSITSVSSPGTGSNSVPIDVQDGITFGISGTNLKATTVNAPFPSVNQTDVGTFGAGNLGNFTNVTLSNGDLALSLTNDWPVTLSMDIEIVDTLNPSIPILSYSFNNVSANGGVDSQSKSLNGVTLPSTMGFSITSVSSPGSGSTSVQIDVNDALTFGISGTNLQVSSLNAAFPSVNLSNVGTYSAGGNLGNVESVTFSDGALALSLTNDWPVSLSMVIDIIDTVSSNSILSYTFNGLAPNGGSSTQSASLVGVTLPASMGLSITSVSSPGTGSTSVPIDLTDAITFGISGTNMKASSVTAPFPAVNESNLGTYSGGNLGNFTDVTFSNGSLDLSLTNNWPIDLSIALNLVNTTNNAVIATYNLNNASANGGTASQSQSMSGITLPSTLGFEIVSVTSPGSPSTSVTINVSDEIVLGVSSTGLKASSFTGPVPSVNENNVGTFAADSLGNFTSASFSSGDLSIGLTNNWAIDLSMTIDLVNSITDSTILTYDFVNVLANGGSNVQTNSLSGVTLPSTLGFKVVSVSSPGSPNTPIFVDLLDEIVLDISGDNLQAASFIGPFPALSTTNAGVFNAPPLSMFTSASFSKGDLSMTLKNDWPIELTMEIELIDTVTSAPIVPAYQFNNVGANGGTATDSKSLVGVTIPNTIAVSIKTVSSPGSSNNSINIDLMDEIEFSLAGTGLEVYNAIVELDTIAITDQKQIVDLGISGVEINTIAFTAGDLDYDFTSTIPADVEITLAFPSTDKNGAPVDTTILVVANQSTTGTISLNSTLFDLTTDTVQDHSRMPVELSATLLGTAGQVQVDSSQGLSVKFDMDNIDFNYIEGYFGDTAVTFPSDNIALNIDFLDQFQGLITFEEPTLGINITSNIGMPMELDLDFSAFRDGTEYPLNGPKQILPFPTTVGDSATGSVFYDNTNSTITNVFTLPFDSVSYGGSITINPDTATYGKYNFVTSDARVTGDLLLELPFTFSTAGISLTQVLDSNLNLESQLTSEYYEIEYAKLIIIATSTLPVDAVVDLNFYDDSGNLVLKKSLPLLESGIPNSNGVVVMPNTLNAELVITETEFADLIQARVVEAEATVISYNNGGTPVKLRTDATVGLAIGLEAKLKVEL